MSDSALAIETSPTITEHTCDHCSQPFRRVQGYVYRDGDACAVYIASCYHHDGHEVFIDCVFSPTWDDDEDDRLTFGCRVGPVAGQSDPGATLVAGAAAFTDRPFFGRKLSREEGLETHFSATSGPSWITCLSTTLWCGTTSTAREPSSRRDPPMPRSVRGSADDRTTS